MTIKQLRRSAPDWTWSAVNHGFGHYSYLGKRGPSEVRVYPVGIMVGPAEDDFATQWRVNVDGNSKELANWLLENGSIPGQRRPSLTSLVHSLTCSE